MPTPPSTCRQQPLTRTPPLCYGAGMQWLVSPRFDVAMIALPLSVAVLAWALIPEAFGRPLWAYVLFVVSFDVAHVWTTGFLTYFDPLVRARRRRLLAGALVGAFFASFAVHAYSAVVYWSALAYIAIGHFIKQQVGFLRLYAARTRCASATDRRWDAGTLWVGALGPIVLWHADPSERFDWFDSGEDFAVALPESVAPAVVIVMVCVATLWTTRQVLHVVRVRRASWGRWMWMVASWATWWCGLRVADSFFVAAAFINLFHGVPYTMLVWHRVRSNPVHRERVGTAVASIASAGRWGAFYAIVLGAALLEETLWELIVWHQYTRGSAPVLPAWSRSVWLSFWVALLSLPQVVHYYLDGVLWRGGPDNADLSAMLSASERWVTGDTDRQAGRWVGNDHERGV